MDEYDFRIQFDVKTISLVSLCEKHMQILLEVKLCKELKLLLVFL